MPHQAQPTTDHEKTRAWAAERGGKPATVPGTEHVSAAAGLLQIDFPGSGQDEAMEPICWDDWFEKLDASNLAIVPQDEQDGATSRFNKIVSRDSLRPSTGARVVTGRQGSYGGPGRRGQRPRRTRDRPRPP